MTRTSPIRHRVRTHKRKERTVQSFLRGKGQKQLKIANPSILIPISLKSKNSFVIDFFSDRTNLSLIKEKSNILRNIENKYKNFTSLKERNLNPEDIKTKATVANKEIFKLSSIISRGISPKYGTMKEILNIMFEDKGNDIVISGGNRSYQSWTLNPEHSFYYALGGSKGFVISVDKSAIKNLRVMEYTNLPNVTIGEKFEGHNYDSNVPWAFWREFEVRSQGTVEIPKKSITIFTDSRTVHKHFNNLGINVIIVNGMYRTMEKLRRLIGVNT